jgi:hypothetical protein
MSKKDSITLSEKYGVNPSVLQCPICGKEFGIAMFGAGLKDKKTGETVEAPRVVALPDHICDECRDVIEKKHGVFFIEVKDGETGPNPYRTGRLVAIKREVAEKKFKNFGPANYMEKSLFSTIFAEAMDKSNDDEPEKSVE